MFFFLVSHLVSWPLANWIQVYVYYMQTRHYIFWPCEEIYSQSGMEMRWFPLMTTRFLAYWMYVFSLIVGNIYIYIYSNIHFFLWKSIKAFKGLVLTTGFNRTKSRYIFFQTFFRKPWMCKNEESTTFCKVQHG